MSLSEYRMRIASENIGVDIPDWLLHPNVHLAHHMRVCPDYDPLNPGDHFEHCKLSNPIVVRRNDGLET